MRIFWIDAPLAGRLAIVTRPLGGERLSGEIAELKREGVTAVLSLLEPDEARELDLEREQEACGSLGIEFTRFPIPDRGTPDDTCAFRAVAKALAKRVTSGGVVAIHCRAGIGRSSLAAATVLSLSGVAGAHAVELISHARGLSVPDTDAQMQWILAF